jgi:hypothetical protein
MAPDAMVMYVHRDVHRHVHRCSRFTLSAADSGAGLAYGR